MTGSGPDALRSNRESGASRASGGINPVCGSGVRMDYRLSIACRWLMALMLVCAAAAAQARTDVKLPAGEYRVESEDLRLTVAGGVVSVMRTWQAESTSKGLYRWHINPAWSDLAFDYDSIDGSIKSISRAGSIFAKSGNGIYVFDRHFFLKATVTQGETDGWRWYDRQGNWITYSIEGRVKAYGDRNGVIVHFQRDAEGRIEQLKDRGDRMILTYQYVSPTSSLVGSIVDRYGRSVTYRYAGEPSRLAEVDDALGNTWKYGYTGKLLTRVEDPEQRVTEVLYGGGRVARVRDSEQNDWLYEYDYDKSKRQFSVVARTPEGRTRDWLYNIEGRLVRERIGTRVTSTVTRDGKNVEIVRNERGLATRTEYDANRNPIKIVHPDGSVSTAVYDAAHNLPVERTDERGVKSRFEYDPRGNLTKFTEAFGLPEQRITDFVYYPTGELKSRTVRGATAADDALSQWEWNADGNIELLTDPEGRETSFDYDFSIGRIVRTDARGGAWVTTIDSRGNLLSESDPLGNTAHHVHDKTGRPVKKVDPLGAETTYEYTKTGLMTAKVDPLGGRATWSYDRDGEKLSQLDEEGTGYIFTYDDDGRIATFEDVLGNATTLSYGVSGDLKGLLTSVAYPTHTETFRFDQRGRMIQRSKAFTAGGSVTTQTSTFGYDITGRMVSETDNGGGTKQYAYDGLGRMSRLTDELGASRTYRYDTRNNLTTLVVESGAEHAFTFDRANAMLSEARPSGATIDYVYDAAGNLTAKIFPARNRETYVYDAAGRKIEERALPAGSNAPSNKVIFNHDAAGRMLDYIQEGRVDTRAIYAYDAKGRVIEETLTYGAGTAAVTRSIQHGYRKNDRRESITYPDGTQIGFTYDQIGNLLTGDVPGITGALRWKDYIWNSPGKLEMPGVVQSFGYDGFNRAVSIESRAIGTGSHQSPAGPTIFGEVYGYDQVGRIETATSAANVTEYFRDAAGRLTGLRPPAGDPDLIEETYTYDSMGNRVTSAAGVWSYNSDDQLIEYPHSGAVHTLSYNAGGGLVTDISRINGNVTKTLSYTYDDGDRMAGVSDDGVVVAEYFYDPFGRRVAKKVGASRTWFYYSNEGLLAEYTENSPTYRLYGYSPISHWGMSPLWTSERTTVTSGENYYYHVDHLSSPTVMTSSDGAVVWSTKSSAFGERSGETGVAQPLGFPGQYHDNESGLQYNYYRSYSSRQGRYVQSDPIGVKGGVNTYLYAKADPLSYFDNLGLNPDCPCDRKKGESANWYGGQIGVSAMAIASVLGASGSIGALINTSTGETCIFATLCAKAGVSAPLEIFGSSMSIEDGPWCGKDLPSLTLSCSLSISVGGSYSDGVPGCGTGKSGGWSGGLKVTPSMTIDFCATTKLGCWGAECECE